MHASQLSKATLKELDKICNDFLWDDSGEVKRIHLVGQAYTFLPKHMGGLGIRSHCDLNYTKLAKLGWKMTKGRGA